MLAGDVGVFHHVKNSCILRCVAASSLRIFAMGFYVVLGFLLLSFCVLHELQSDCRDTLGLE